MEHHNLKAASLACEGPGGCVIINCQQSHISCHLGYCHSVSTPMTNGNEPKRLLYPEEPRAKPPERLVTPELEGGQLEAGGETAKPKEPAPPEGVPKTPSFLPRLRRAAPAIPQVRDELTIRIEKIMEEGVGDAYARLSTVAKEEFKLKGEEAAGTIRDLLRSTHVKVKKIFRLVLDWLRLLPGLNRFFLEQEAKIKTDRIISLHRQRRP